MIIDVLIVPEWDADFCCDLAELMVSPDQDVLSAGVPTELRVRGSKRFQLAIIKLLAADFCISEISIRNLQDS